MGAPRTSEPINVPRLITLLLLSFGAANVVGAVVVFVYQTFVTDGPPQSDTTFAARRW